MFADTDIKLDYADVLMVPRKSSLSSRSQIGLEVDHFEVPVVPIIAANMDGVGTFAMARELSKLKLMTSLIKYYSLEELLDFYEQEDSESNYAIYTMGIGESDYTKFVKFASGISGRGIATPIAISIDVANGYTHDLDKMVSKMREHYPDYILMVGNVVTPERTEELIDCGADIVKIGVGPGSVCTTRKITGVGYPQFSAVLECASAADSAGGSICADGGITCPGDAAKAFAAGAKYVMIGGLFAGCYEGMNEDQIEVANHTGLRNSLPFYGMASKEAQDKHNNGMSSYRAAEGKLVDVNYRGPIKPIVEELLGGLRSSCTYIGADGIESMRNKARFIRVNRQLNGIYS